MWKDGKMAFKTKCSICKKPIVIKNLCKWYCEDCRKLANNKIWFEKNKYIVEGIQQSGIRSRHPSEKGE